MKKLIVLVALSFFGCQADTDEYYIKYSIEGSLTSSSIGGGIDLVLNNENGEQLELTVGRSGLTETTIGPVPYGFIASMLAMDNSTRDNLRLYANILVSKNCGPFALKAMDESDEVRKTVSLDYTIDF